MPDTHSKVQNRNNYNHWKILDLVLITIIFHFLTLINILTRNTYLNTKR